MNQTTPFSSTKAQNYYQLAANQIYHEMTGNSDEMQVIISPCTSYAATLPEQKHLLLHPLTFLQPEDLPEDLQVKSPDDPKLQSNKYFIRLKIWLAQTFAIDPSKLENLRDVFNMHLHIWKNSQLIDRIKRFAIAHEIGHIFHHHTSGNWDRFFSYTVSFVITVFLLDLFPLLLAVFLCIMVIDVSQRVFKALREYSEQYQEKEADLTAIQHTKDLPAAIAFFNALDTSKKHRWDQTSWYNKLVRILFFPESLFDISHPSPQDRIQYIQNAVVKV